MKHITYFGNPAQCIIGECLNAIEYMKEALEMEGLINDKQLKNKITKAIAAIRQVQNHACAMDMQRQEEEGDCK